jgi:tetratricopeptide (TPR) repeat protein
VSYLAVRGTTVLLIGIGIAACDRPPGVPEPGSPAYQEAVGAFFTGVAALQVGEAGLAEAALVRVTEIVPREPAAWADLGLISLQRNALETAAERLDRARALAPDNSAIQLLSGLTARERGRTRAATEHLRRAVELDPLNLRAVYLQAQLAELDGGSGAAARAQQLMEQALEVQPGNSFALLEHARLAARAGDPVALEQSLQRYEVRVADPASADLAPIRAAAAAGQLEEAAVRIGRLQTQLERVPDYQADRDVLVISPGMTELVLLHFVHLPNPSAEPAPADTGLVFAPEPLGAAAGSWDLVRALWLADDAPLAVLAANQREVSIRTGPAEPQRFAFPGGGSAAALGPAAVTALDYDFSFRADLLLAGAGGLRLLRQDTAGIFADVTAEAIPASAAQGAYTGAWAADLDMDGDLDLILAQAEGPPLVLLNGGDGSFARHQAFPGATRVRAFAWADFDADGTPDAAMIDADGRLHVYLNRRFRDPQFEAIPLPPGLGPIHAIAGADLTQDAIIDLLALQQDGSLIRLSLRGEAWETESLAHWPAFAPREIGSTRLFLADLDNNSGLDIVAASPEQTQVWLRTPEGLLPHQSIAARVTDIADFRGEGRLDLIGLAPDQSPVWLANRGELDYFSLTFRPRSARADGDRRINSLGIGGEIEVRAGLLYQKQVIQGHSVHFGLGGNPEASVARIIWPNGTVQAEFRLAATSEGALLAEQRLKGSCPWVFTYNGQGMEYITDFIWRTALGLRINMQGTADVIHSEDWIKIRGDQLVPRDGFYEVRITADLWETHFFDHVALKVVDRPAGTEMFVDERFTLPPPTLALHAMSPLRPIAGAWDHHGRDVTEIVQTRDARYLDGFALGTYQGLAEEHYVEIDLGADAPREGPLWLVAHGWLYPTDSSINVAISQGDHPPLQGLQLEVPDGNGGWVVAQPDLGMPAGKAKTILIDLQHAFRPGAPRRLRLRTSMEIYWDRIAWAIGKPDAALQTQRVLPASAELRFRGFSAVHKPNRRSPQVPDYTKIATTAPKWRDLEGYYTRYGDVLPLVEAVDGRYVIMNAGDELVFHFPELPPPPDGWERDFVLIGDGWVKDGDYNTGFSRTVMPLPYRGMTTYNRAPTRLEEDPGYRLHPEDWKVFHTRYVSPRHFHHALVPRAPAFMARGPVAELGVTGPRR